jgi:hypothetical protein
MTSEPILGRRRCYVASPLGFNDAGRTYYYEHYLPALEGVVLPVDPWAMVSRGAVVQATETGALRELWLGIGQRNLDVIAGCDLLVAWLDGQEVDSGTATEIGYAAGKGVRCFGLRTDLRQAGEEGVAVNLQVEATVVSTGGRVATSLAELVLLLTPSPTL